MRRPLLLLLALALVVGCSPRRGGGGGGGGVGDDDDVVNSAETGPGRNLGDAESGGTATGFGEGSATLYVVNLSGAPLDFVEGWHCAEEDFFNDAERGIAHGRYLEVTNLASGCWSVSAFGEAGGFEERFDSVEGEYTWVVTPTANGDDDDVGDDDDDGGNVVLINESEYDFYELNWFDLDSQQIVQICLPFEIGMECATTVSGTVGFVAFLDEGQTKNPDNCFLVTETYDIAPGDFQQVVFQGGDLQCL